MLLRRPSIALWIVLLLPGIGPAGTYDVRSFGAKGDKESLDSPAIQAAIDACVKAGGGTVLVPPGDYRCGALGLGNHVQLQIQAGATLWSSDRKEDYRGERYLIVARDAEQVSVVGPGTLRGLGEGPLGRRADKTDKAMPEFRPGILRFEGCRDTAVRNLRILYSDTWTLHFRFCENVLVDGVTIRNEYFHTNSDGIDPVSCRNVRIANCDIVSGDDCIVCKTAEGKPCENVVISNCVLESIATAIKLGTESSGDFRNIHVSNCSIRNATVGIGLYVKDGGCMERVTFSDIDLENFTPQGQTNVEKSMYPIFMDIERRHKDSPVGRIRDLSLVNIQIASGAGALIQGMPESPIENLTLRNVTFRVTTPVDHANRRKHVGGNRTFRDERDTLYSQSPTWLALAHVRRAVVDQVSVFATEDHSVQFPRSVIQGNKLEDAVIENVYRCPDAGEGMPARVVLQDCAGKSEIPSTKSEIRSSKYETRSKHEDDE